MKMTLEQMEALEKAGIIEVKGISGIPTDAKTASQAPQLCQVHSMASKAYNLSYDGKEFILIGA